ncbi:MAG: TIGR00341 family protein [Nitrospinaceae bacterium]
MKIIEIYFEEKFLENVTGIAKKYEAEDYWIGDIGGDGRRFARLLVSPNDTQKVLDALQGAFGKSSSSRITVTSAEVVLPKIPDEEEEAKKKITLTTREELYNKIEKNSQLNSTYLLLVFLSTIVVAIGLIKDNVAVVIGAMVIAPLLGPNLALALGTALGDMTLMWKAAKTTLAGMGFALALCIVIGLLWPLNGQSHELLSRTDVGMDSVALALASGAAAVISLTTGLPSVLVGVMVAVALLPPTAALGLMIGAQKMELAWGAGLLLAVNVVAVNLAAKVAFLYQGIKPRTWLEKEKARQSMTIYIVLWIFTLAVLIAAIYLKNTMNV